MKMIVAMTDDSVIGLKGNMPWGRFSADLKRFKRLTLGHHIIIGRKTYESLPFKPLPGRTNIVVSSNKVFADTLVAKTTAEAIYLSRNAHTFVIGGSANI